eukprot:6277121-Alexandrium_andersonii.AAC.1
MAESRPWEGLLGPLARLRLQPPPTGRWRPTQSFQPGPSDARCAMPHRATEACKVEESAKS